MNQTPRKMAPDEYLKLQQLRILEWYEEQKYTNKNDYKKDDQQKSEQIPKQWKLTKGLSVNIDFDNWFKEVEIS